MTKQFINDILHIAHQHILVGDTAYKRETNINDQHNHKYYQFLIDNEGVMQITSPTTLQYTTSITVLGTGTTLDVQEQALHIFLDVLEMINDTLQNVEISTYNALFLTEYTDDNCSGIRATVSFILPIPVNLCEYASHFVDKLETETDNTINLDDSDNCTSAKNTKDSNKEITLTPLKLY